jgi:hypothetical protein
MFDLNCFERFAYLKVRAMQTTVANALRMRATFQQS